MTRRLTLLYVVTALLTSPAFALDQSLEQSFGKNRVKIQRLEAPKEVSQSKLETARARYKSQMKICRGKADRQKQYCMQEAENQLMIDERKIRQRARAEDAAREGGGS